MTVETVCCWLESLTFNPFIDRVSLEWPPSRPYHVSCFDAEGNVVHDQLKNLEVIA